MIIEKNKKNRYLYFSFGTKENEEMNYLYEIAKHLQKTSKKRFAFQYKIEEEKKKAKTKDK